ncbi:dnk [Trypoxylus dichotomus]
MILQKSCLYTKSRFFMRLFSLSSSQNINQKWREERGLPLNPNACGVLTDRPDYSYLDGRPTPIGILQLQGTKQ